MSGLDRHTDLMAYLAARGTRYLAIGHPPCYTSAESARARAAAGEPDAIGAKALVVKLQRDASFALLVLPGTSRLDSRAARRSLGHFRFADADELLAVTDGLEPGSVPPFGRPCLPGVDAVYLDRQIVSSGKIGFNAAALDRSIVMATAEYLRLLGAYLELYLGLPEERSDR